MKEGSDDSLGRLRERYGDLSDEDFEKVIEALKKYLVIADRVADDITRDPARSARFEEDIKQRKQDRGEQS
jgi:hypothetical protein